MRARDRDGRLLVFYPLWAVLGIAILALWGIVTMFRLLRFFITGNEDILALHAEETDYIFGDDLNFNQERTDDEAKEKRA